MSAAPLTVEAANALLSERNIPGRFTEDLLAGARRKHNSRRIRDAIHRAPSDRGAHQFLVNLLTGTDAPDRAAPGSYAATDHPSSPRSRARDPAPQENDAMRAHDSIPPFDDDFPPLGDPGGDPHRADTRRAPQSPVAPQRGRRDPTGEQPRYPLTFKAYGRKAALEFRAHQSKQGYDTVMLEGAASRGERQYDWQNKISVMIMQRELPEVAAVLMGALKRCEFKHHGPQKNKGFSIEHQGDKFFIRVFRTGDDHAVHGVPVPFEDAFYVTGLVLRQIGRTARGTDAEMITTALRAYARLKRAR